MPLLKFSPYDRKFDQLKLSGENFLPWEEAFKKYAVAHGLDSAIPSAFGKDDSAPVDGQLKTVVLMALHAHLDQGLCDLLHGEADPNKAWTRIKTKFDIILSNRRAVLEHEYSTAGFDQFKDPIMWEARLNSLVRNLYLAGSKLNITDADKIEKTIETLGTEHHALQMTLRSRKYSGFDEFMAHLQMQDYKNQVAHKREDKKRRRIATGRATNAETHLARAEPYVKKDRGHSKFNNKKSYQKSFDKKEHAPKKAFTPKGKSTERQCFGCGSTKHLFADCNASEEDLLRYAKKRRDAAKSRAESNAESNHISVQMEDKQSGEEYQAVEKGIACLDLDEAEINAAEGGDSPRVASVTEKGSRV